MSIIHDQANVSHTGDLSPSAQYTTEHYGRESDDAAHSGSPDRADNNFSDFGCPIEDWQVD